jgi:hypothetical protein
MEQIMTTSRSSQAGMEEFEEKREGDRILSAAEYWPVTDFVQDSRVQPSGFLTPELCMICTLVQQG